MNWLTLILWWASLNRMMIIRYQKGETWVSRYSSRRSRFSRSARF